MLRLQASQEGRRLSEGSALIPNAVDKSPRAMEKDMFEIRKSSLEEPGRDRSVSE